MSRLRACGPVIPGILLLRPELVRLWYAAGRHGTRSITVMNTISLLVGRACTNLTERWRALFAQYFSLRGCWPSGFPINAMRIITKSGDHHQSDFDPGYGYPRKDTAQKKTKNMLYLQKNQWRFPEWARERATRDYLGRSIQQDGYWSKDLEYRPGAVFKGTSR